MKRVALAVLAVLLLTGCGASSYETAANEITVRYGNGFTEEKDYKGVVLPGLTNEWEFGTGAGDDLYKYPRTKRAWIASTTINADGTRSKPGHADRAAVECVTQDETRMLVDYAVYFTLNQTGMDTPDQRGPDGNPPLRQFHEQIGLKTKAWTDAGWANTLNVYFDTPIEREIVNVCGDYESSDLRSNNVTRHRFAGDITAGATDAIERSIGGRYFCGPEDEGGNQCGNIVFEVGRPELVNRDIVKAEEQKRINAANAEAQLDKNTEITNRLRATRQEVDLLGADNYVMLEAIKSGQVTFMQLPQGTSVTVPSGGN